MELITLVMVWLSVARLTRLVVADSITDPIRLGIVDRFGSDSKITYLVHCPWCVSVYIGAGMSGAWCAWGSQRWFLAATLALSASHVAGYLVSRED